MATNQNYTASGQLEILANFDGTYESAYPTGNKPDATVLFSDDFASGDLTKTQNSVVWDPANVGVDDTVGVVANKLEFFFAAEPDLAQGSNAEQRMSLGASYTEIYIKYDITIPANYEHRNSTGADNNKFIAIYKLPYGSGFESNFSTGLGTTTSDSDMTIHPLKESVELPNVTEADFITSADAGNTIEIIVHMKVPTGDGTNNGVMQMWKDGVLRIDEQTLDNWGGTGDNYFDGLYLLGASNSGFTANTTFLIDNIELYNAVAL